MKSVTKIFGLLIPSLLCSTLFAEGILVGPQGTVYRGESREKADVPSGVDLDKNRGAAGRGGIANPNLEAIRTAQDAFAEVDSRLKSVFSETPEMKSAAEALHNAQQMLNAAETQVMAGLLADPTYSATLVKRDAAKQKLDELRASERAAPEQITAAAAEAMTHGSVLTRMQTDAMRKSLAVTDGKKALAAASASIADLQKKLKESLAQNTEWTGKKKKLDDARAKLAIK